LRYVVIAKLAIAGGGVLLIGGGNSGSRGVGQREFDDSLQRDWFGQQRAG